RVAAGMATALAGFAAGAGRAVRASLRLAIPLLLVMVAVNALVTHRGDTVLIRGWEVPVLGNSDVTLGTTRGGRRGRRAVPRDGAPGPRRRGTAARGSGAPRAGGRAGGARSLGPARCGGVARPRR